MDSILNRFPAKNALDAGFSNNSLGIFLRMIAQPDKSPSGAWTQTPISAWLASVTIIPLMGTVKWGRGRLFGLWAQVLV